MTNHYLFYSLYSFILIKRMCLKMLKLLTQHLKLKHSTITLVKHQPNTLASGLWSDVMNWQ